jgi:CheY-like chemotaxis protein
VAGEHILVVDDGADMREFVIKFVLQPNGYEYSEAEDGVAALEQITISPPDLILLDLQMPRLDGTGLLRKMQEREINIPVVLMTFYGSEEIAIEVFRLGVRDYVIKPFTEDELLGAIERALMVSRLRRERDSLTERLMYANRGLERHVGELEALFRVGKVVASLPDEDTLMVRILEAATYLANASEAALLLLSDDGKTLINRAFTTGADVQLIHEAVDDELAWQAVQSGQPVVGQPYPDDRTHVPNVAVRVPLVAGDVPIGVLAVTTPEELTSRDQLNLIGALADYGAIALERAHLAASLGKK